MADKGWIKVFRCIKECDIWLSQQPFDRRSAWIDLLLMANHEDRTILVGTTPLPVHRGQTFTSIRKLTSQWHWRQKKTRCFLGILVDTGMVTVSSTRLGTLITIINYDNYQGILQDDEQQGHTEGHTSGHKKGTHRGERWGTQGRTNNNTKKIKKERDGDGATLDELKYGPGGIPYE